MVPEKQMKQSVSSGPSPTKGIVSGLANLHVKMKFRDRFPYSK
jgi:hypothetical protein